MQQPCPLCSGQCGKLWTRSVDMVRLVIYYYPVILIPWWPYGRDRISGHHRHPSSIKNLLIVGDGASASIISNIRHCTFETVPRI